VFFVVFFTIFNCFLTILPFADFADHTPIETIGALSAHMEGRELVIGHLQHLDI
jgi:hypothetical protein